MRDCTDLAVSARDGLADINAFIGTRLDLADRYEAEGDTKTAEEVRAVWTGVLASVDVIDRAVQAELGTPDLVPA